MKIFKILSSYLTFLASVPYAAFLTLVCNYAHAAGSRCRSWPSSCCLPCWPWPPPPPWSSRSSPPSTPSPSAPFWRLQPVLERLEVFPFVHYGLNTFFFTRGLKILKNELWTEVLIIDITITVEFRLISLLGCLNQGTK